MLFRGKNLFADLAHSNWIGLNTIVTCLDSAKRDIGLTVEDLDKFLSYGQHVAVGYGDVENLDDVAGAAREVMRGIFGFVDGKSIKSLMVWISGPPDMCVVKLSKFNTCIQQSLNENCDYLWELKQYDDEKSIKVVVHAVWGYGDQEGTIPVFGKKSLLGDVTHSNWLALRELADDLKVDDGSNVICDLDDYKKFLEQGQYVATGVGVAKDEACVEEAAIGALNAVGCYGDTAVAKEAMMHISAGPAFSMADLTKLGTKITESFSDDCVCCIELKPHEEVDHHIRLVLQTVW